MAETMRQPFDVQGVWWLPHRPDRKVQGWFSWDPNNGGTLRLAGSLQPLEWVDNEFEDGSRQRYVSRGSADVSYPRVHGQAGPRLLNLEDCFRTSFERKLCREEDVAERIHVNWLLTGAWFEASDDPPEVHGAVAELQFLTSWIDNDALNLEHSDQPSEIFLTATARKWVAPTVDLVGGLTMRFAQHLGTGGDHREELSFEQQIVCDLRSENPVSLDEFTTQIGHLQDLLTITSGRVANIRDVYFTHVDVPKLAVSGRSVAGSREELRLYTRWANRDTAAESLSPYAMLFTYEEFDGKAGVARWMATAAKYRSELKRIMAARYNRSMFVEDRVANVVAALESFDRTRRADKDGHTHLVTRLRNCVEFAGEPFANLLGGESVDDWTKRARNHRNALGHHLDEFRRNMSLVERELADQLLWLGQFCLLRAAGTPDTVFEKIAHDSHFKWVAKRAMPAPRGRS